MIPAVRLATHEIDDLVRVRTREARLKRLHQVKFNALKYVFTSLNVNLNVRYANSHPNLQKILEMPEKQRRRES